jgi:hypothetical protein
MIWEVRLVLGDDAALDKLPSAAGDEPWGACVGLTDLRDPAGPLVTPEFVRTGEYQVNVGGQRYPAAVQLRPPFDPAGLRIKGT